MYGFKTQVREYLLGAPGDKLAFVSVKTSVTPEEVANMQNAYDAEMLLPLCRDIHFDSEVVLGESVVLIDKDGTFFNSTQVTEITEESPYRTKA